MKSRVVLGLSILLASPQPRAEEVVSLAISGDDARVRRYFAWNRDCSYRRISVDITAEPLHGKVEPKFGDYLVPATVDVQKGKIGNCVGKALRVVELHYTSEAGYTGKDRFTVRVHAEHFPSYTDDITVEVK